MQNKNDYLHFSSSQIQSTSPKKLNDKILITSSIFTLNYKYFDLSQISDKCTCVLQ